MAPIKEHFLCSQTELDEALMVYGLKIRSVWTKRDIVELLVKITRLQADRDQLQLSLECELGVRHMTVDRLGGLVEGQPTYTGNFLQRIDELVRKEADRDALVEVAEWAMTFAQRTVIFEDEYKRHAATLRRIKERK